MAIASFPFFTQQKIASSRRRLAAARRARYGKWAAHIGWLLMRRMCGCGWTGCVGKDIVVAALMKGRKRTFPFHIAGFDWSRFFFSSDRNMRLLLMKLAISLVEIWMGFRIADMNGCWMLGVLHPLAENGAKENRCGLSERKQMKSACDCWSFWMFIIQLYRVLKGRVSTVTWISVWISTKISCRVSVAFTNRNRAIIFEGIWICNIWDR